LQLHTGKKARSGRRGEPEALHALRHEAAGLVTFVLGSGASQNDLDVLDFSGGCRRQSVGMLTKGAATSSSSILKNLRHCVRRHASSGIRLGSVASKSPVGLNSEPMVHVRSAWKPLVSVVQRRTWGVQAFPRNIKRIQRPQEVGRR